MSLGQGVNRIRFTALSLGLVALASCAERGADTSGRHFTDLNLGGRTSADVARKAADAAPAPISAVSAEQAKTHLLAYLTAAGFQPQAQPFAGGLKISGAVMASPAERESFDLDGQCPLKALERPKMSTTEVEATLIPTAAATGFQLAVKVHITELDANLVSGALSKRACPSRGLLEAALRRAAFGG
jgi:hypothetical protein